MTLLERLNERWERMDGAAAAKIDRILKERREAATEIAHLRNAARAVRDDAQVSGDHIVIKDLNAWNVFCAAIGDLA